MIALLDYSAGGGEDWPSEDDLEVRMYHRRMQVLAKETVFWCALCARYVEPLIVNYSFVCPRCKNFYLHMLIAFPSNSAN